MSIYQSRHTHYSKKTVPHKKRTLKLYAEGEWKDKWFKCWNCGQINNADRAQVAATFQGGDSVEIFEYDDLAPTVPYGPQDYRYLILTLDQPSMSLMQVDANGTVIAPQVSAGAKITSGCAFCGCLNWR